MVTAHFQYWPSGLALYHHLHHLVKHLVMFPRGIDKIVMENTPNVRLKWQCLSLIAYRKKSSETLIDMSNLKMQAYIQKPTESILQCIRVENEKEDPSVPEISDSQISQQESGNKYKTSSVSSLGRGTNRGYKNDTKPKSKQTILILSIHQTECNLEDVYSYIEVLQLFI